MGEIDLPVTWANTTVGEAYQVIGGGTPATGKPEYWNGNTPWITSADIEGVRLINVRKHVSEKGIAESTTNRVPAKTLLVVTRVGLGKIAIAETPVCFSQDLQGLIQDEHLISPEFALYFLSYQLQFLKFEGQGTTISGVTKKQLKDLAFPLPPHNEQHRIVAKIEELFSELDKGIEALKTAREQIKVYRQALLKHAFEGKLTAAWRAANPDKLEPAAALLARIQSEREQRYQQQLQHWQTHGGNKPKAPKPLPPLSAEELAELPELPVGWGWVRMGELTSIIAGNAFEKAEYSDSGIRLFQIANVSFGEIVWDKVVYLPEKYWDDYPELKLFSGDLVMALNRPLLGNDLKIGRLGLTDTPSILYQRVGKFVTHSEDVTNLIYWYLRSPDFIAALKNELRGVNIPFINQSRLMDYPVPLCDFDELAQIIAELENAFSIADQLDQILATSLQQSEALRQSILKRAFAGTLVAQDPHDEPAAVLLERIKEGHEHSSKPKRRKSA